MREQTPMVGTVDDQTNRQRQYAPRGPSVLSAMQKQIDEIRRNLCELWQDAAHTERMFAVDRMLRDCALPAAAATELGELQDRVRDAWAAARLQAASAPRFANAKLAGLQLTLAERELDGYLEAHGLYDALFTVAEAYLHEAPIVASMSFRELVAERDRVRARLVPILPPLDD